MQGRADCLDTMRASIAKLLVGVAIVAVATILPLGMSPAAADAGPTQGPVSSPPGAEIQAEAEVTQALAGIDPSLTGAARNAAIEQALQQLAQTNATMGPAAISALVAAELKAGVPLVVVIDATLRGATIGGMAPSTAIAAITTSAIEAGAPATDVTAQIIATGGGIPLPDNVVGEGLGIAAAQLESIDMSGARAIAETVADEGTYTLRTAYAAAVTANGGSQELASLGTGNPEVKGNQGGNSQGNNNNGQGNGGQNLPPCGSPSCT